jgi:hypothetical protein
MLLVATLVAPFALTNVSFADEAPAKPAKKTTKKASSKKVKKVKTEAKSDTGNSGAAAPTP